MCVLIMHQIELNLDSHGALDGRWRLLSSFFSSSLFVCCDLPLLPPEDFAAIELPTFRDASWRNDSAFAFCNTFHLYATVRVSSDLMLFVQDLSVTYFGGFFLSLCCV